MRIDVTPAALCLTAAATCLTVPAQGALVAHWEFDEPGLPTSAPGNGSYVTTESVSASNIGTFWGQETRPFNDTSVANSPAGGGKAFFDPSDIDNSGNNPSGPHIVITGADGALPDGGSNRTIAAWINATDQVENNATIFSYGTNVNGQRASFLLNSSGKLRFEIQGTGFAAGTGPDLQDSQWHHVAVVLDNAAGDATISDVKLYIDGTEYTNASANAIVIDTVIGGLTSEIGNQSNAQGSRGFTGAIDDVRVYDEALTQSEIQALADVPEPGSLALLGLAGMGLLARRRR